MTIEAAFHVAKKLRSAAFDPDAAPIVMLDAAETIERLADQLQMTRTTNDHLEGIISNLRAKLHHLQMVDSGE